MEGAQLMYHPRLLKISANHRICLALRYRMKSAECSHVDRSSSWHRTWEPGSFWRNANRYFMLPPNPNASHHPSVWACHMLDNPVAFAVETDTKTWFVMVLVGSAFSLPNHELYSLVPDGFRPLDKVQSRRTSAELRLWSAMPVAFHCRCTNVVPALYLSCIACIRGKACCCSDFYTLYRWTEEWIPMPKPSCFRLWLVRPSSHKAFLASPVLYPVHNIQCVVLVLSLSREWETKPGDRKTLGRWAYRDAKVSAHSSRKVFWERNSLTSSFLNSGILSHFPLFHRKAGRVWHKPLSLSLSLWLLYGIWWGSGSVAGSPRPCLACGRGCWSPGSGRGGGEKEKSDDILSTNRSLCKGASSLPGPEALHRGLVCATAHSSCLRGAQRNLLFVLISALLWLRGCQTQIKLVFRCFPDFGSVFLNGNGSGKAGYTCVFLATRSASVLS